MVLAGLGRAYVGVGDWERGRKAFEEAQKNAAAPLKRQLDDKLAKLYAVRPK